MSKPNVVIIVLDTLRKDFAEKYLNEDLKKLGFKYYDNVVSTSSWTVPAHASMLTGLYPKDHESYDRGNHFLDVIFKKKKLSLQYYFSIKKYRTLLVSANPYVSPYFGFDNFDKYFNLFSIINIRGISISERNFINLLKRRYHSKIEVYFHLLLNRPLLFLKLLHIKLKSMFHKKLFLKLFNYPLNKGLGNINVDFKDRNTFAVFNFMELHEPYLHEKNIGTYSNFDRCFNCNKAQLFSDYKLHTLFVKDHLVSFLNKLINDNSLIILLSDHGQQLCETGWFGHEIFLNDTLIRVPMWIYIPSKIESKSYTHHNEWISIKNVFYFLFNFIKDGECNEQYLYSSYVFSEVHKNTEIPKEVSGVSFNLKKYEHYVKDRVAVYYKNYKMTYNVDDDVVEELINYEGGQVPKQMQTKLKTLIKKYLNNEIH